MINRICRFVGLLVMMACPIKAGIRWDQVPTPPEAGLADKDGVCLAVETQWAKPGQWAVPNLTRGVKIPGFDPYAYQGIAVSFYINRVVTSQVGSDGFLLNPETLIQEGVIAPTITVEFPILFGVIDIRNGQIWPASSIAPESRYQFQLMSVNGKRLSARTHFSYPFQGAEWDYSNLGYLRYKTITVEIPIAMVRFPIMRDIGQPSVPILNEIAIYDGHSYGGLTWGPMTWIHVPWIKTTVKAMAPIFLVHGAGDSADDWKSPSSNDFLGYQNIMEYFNGAPFLWTNDISLGFFGAASREANAKELASKIPNLLMSWGAKSCHIIAHSKGGLDTRTLLASADYQKLQADKQIEILSLTTISTPHKGSVLADIACRTPTLLDSDYDENDVVQEVMHTWPWYKRLANNVLKPVWKTIRALKTDNCAEFNAAHPITDFIGDPEQGKIKFFNVAGDADANKNAKISNFEAAGEPEYNYDGLLGKVIDAGTAEILNSKADWQYAAFSYQVHFYTNGTYSYSFIGSPGNDLRVDVNSALLLQDPEHNILPVQMLNHQRIRNKELAAQLVQNIQNNFP